MPGTPSQIPPFALSVAYQQALHDFAITDLLAQLQNSQPITELESEVIAALLVEQLADNLDSHLVSTYLKAIRQDNKEIIPEPINLQYPESTELPANFPAPRFNYGDRIRLCSVSSLSGTEAETDTGRCIGHYYAYAAHHCEWMWKYVIWIEKDSVSASWCVATTACEDELQPVNQQESV